MLLAGTQVKARGLRWEVVYGHPAGEQTLYRLRCSEGDLAGREVDILTPFESITPIITAFDPTKAASIARWKVYHEAFLLEQALGSDALLAIQPGRLVIEPYQMVPVMRALQMSRPRLLLADGVGLGKTIEAGLIISELIARRRAHRILIVTPAGPLLKQWYDEMRDRFGLRFTVLDRNQLQENRARMELGANPFDLDSLGLISIDFAKQEKVLQELERTQYDVIIVDEAHHCMRLDQAGDSEDSLRRRLAEVLAARSDALILASATPHDGYDPHFASLMEILDPSLVDGRGTLRGDAYRKYVIRRLKSHITDPKTKEPKFKKREVHPIRIIADKRRDADFIEFQERVIGLVAPLLRRAKRGRRYSDVLAFISLLKRSVSSVRACRITLERIVENLGQRIETGGEDQEARRQRLRTLLDIRRRMERFGVLSYEEEQDQAVLEAEDMASEIFENGPEALENLFAETQRETRRERDRLKRLKETQESLAGIVTIARKAEKTDPKLLEVLLQIRSIREKEPHTNILVYTEFSDTQDALMEYVSGKKKEITGEILQLSGADDEKTRTQLASRFSKDRDLILVSTDATAEGLNLHTQCHHLIHVELPYNPNRLEQRNGRIDRFGQKFDPQVRYLFLGGTFEERLLARLIAKYERQRSRLTFVPDTLGAVAVLENHEHYGVSRLLDGLSEEDHQLFKSPDKYVDWSSGSEEPLDSPAYRELLEDIDKAISGFDKTAKAHSWLAHSGLNAEESRLKEASAARKRSRELGISDLLHFLINALRADTGNGDAAKEVEPHVWLLRLPFNWAVNLNDIPGYDSDARTLLVTDDIEIEETKRKETVGYIGRAHPIVRRAIERVRNIQYKSDDRELDSRIAAVSCDESSPAILYTFLGRIQSDAGPEFERVLAVRIPQSGSPAIVQDPNQWMPLADPLKGVPTADLWKNRFAAWADGSEAKAKNKAATAFSILASEFLKKHMECLQSEEDELKNWLSSRAEELCGGSVEIGIPDLFSQLEETGPDWRALQEPHERLAAFAKDSAVAQRLRGQANTVLTLFKTRNAEITKRLRTKDPEISSVGMLLLVPRGGREVSDHAARPE